VKIYDERGRRVKRRFATEREARATLDEARRRRDTGFSALPARHTMGDLFDAWLGQLHDQVNLGERSPTTWREYESYVREHMRPALGAIDCRKLTVKQVEDFLSSLPLSAKTRANQRAILRRALNVARRWHWVDQNVAAETDPIPVRPREISALSLADAERFLFSLRGDVLYSAFVVALYTGLRAGELAALRVEDVNLNESTVRIHQQIQPVKGHGLTIRPLKSHASAARLDLVPAAVLVLIEAIGERTEGYVWESKAGRPYYPTSITHAFTRALARAGLRHLRLHDLRHYFISFLPQLDVHPAVAQRLARHASISTTLDVYTSVEDAAKREAIGRLHEAISNPVGPSTGPRQRISRVL
jgi:integrase